MSVPTITSVTPSSGVTRGGNLVEIEGTNFRVPSDGTPESLGNGKAVPTISVQFDGVSSDYAHAITSSRAIARVPQWRGDPKDIPKSMTVRLANLDDSHVEIPGENVELADGYTVERPRLTVRGITVRVMREFLEEIRRHIHPNVWFTTERFYWDMSEGVPDEIRQATKPLVHINGLSMEANEDEQGMGGKDVETSSEVWHTYPNGRAVDLVIGSIDIYSSAEHTDEIFNLGRAMVAFADECPFLTVERESWDVGDEDYKYPMTLPDDGLPSYDVGPSMDGLKYCRVSMVIEGIELNDPNAQPYEWTEDWSDLELDFQRT